MVHVFFVPAMSSFNTLAQKKAIQTSVCVQADMSYRLGRVFATLLPQLQIPLQHSPSATVETFSHSKREKQER